MNSTQSLQNLLNNTASEEDIALLKRLLASGEISIGGNVNQSVIIIGSGNTVELPPAALDRLNARPMLGNLDRDLTGEEITAGLRRLDKLLPNRAPVLLPHYKEQVGRLRPTLKTEIKSLSETARRERLEALAAINSICVEAVDVSFNGLSLGEEAPKYDARSPFRGLESFRPEDSEFFFGREALTRKLVAQIQAHPFLAVLGASGSGKSSLVMAGVIPALASDYRIFRPGTNPLDELESARGKSLIVVDQFEELFTLTRDESTRKDFIARLLDFVPRSRIILTLRSDFLGEVGAYRTLGGEIQSHLEIIPPMDMDELRRAMEGQAGVVGLRFEADLSQQILDDVAGEPGAMPLLQHALWELWNRRHGRNLRASEYRAFGGVKQAITSTAEKVYADCSKPEQDQLRDIFLRLTRLDEGVEGRDTRRRVPLGDLIPSGRDAASITLLLDKLANARLIVKTVNEDKTEVEVAHEALIRHWERLRIWLNEDRDALRLRESVSESAKEWENVGRDESMLNHRGGRLDDALVLGENSQYGLTEIEQAYLNACVTLRNREQRERERRRKITLASIFAVIAVIMAIVTGWSISSTKSANANATQVSIANTAQSDAKEQANAAATAQVKAEEQARIALARQLSVQAQSIADAKDLRQPIAVLLAAQSMKLFPHVEAAKVLQSNTLAVPIVSMFHEKYIHALVFSPDSRYIATGGTDNTVRVRDAMSGKEITRMKHDGDGNVYSIAFSPDSRYLVSGSGDGTARVWDILSGLEITRVTHEDYLYAHGEVYAVAFSPDGRYVVSGSRDKTARVWDAKSGKEVSRIFHNCFIFSAQFSPNGIYIVTGDCDNTVRVWEAASGKEIAQMKHDGGTNNESVNSVAFSPDGRYIVSGSQDGTARIWDAMSGKEISRVTHDEGALARDDVKSVAFSPNGKYAVSGSIDKTSRVWDIDTGQEVARMHHDGFVESVAFSPDGRYVISGICIQDEIEMGGCVQGVAEVWEVATGQEVAYMQHDAGVNYVAIAPNGRYIASGDEGGIVHIWKAIDWKEFTHLPYGYTVSSVAYSPDGKYVLSGGCDQFTYNGEYNEPMCRDGISRMWAVTTLLNSGALIDEEIIQGKIHGSRVYSVAFSPNGLYMAMGIDDTTIRVVDVNSKQEVARMYHDLSVYSIAFSPDSRYIVSGSNDKTARVWDVASGQEIARMTHDGFVKSVAFSPDGRYVASGSLDNNVRIWDTLNGNEVVRINHKGAVKSISFSPDGSFIATASEDGTAKVWDTKNGKEVANMIHGYWVNAVAFSPDGRYVISGGCDQKNYECMLGTARVWDAMNGNEIIRMTYNSEISSVAFSSDGRYVIAGGCDQSGVSGWFCKKGVTRIWDVTTRQEIAILNQRGPVFAVAFSPDSRYFVSGSYGLSVWKFKSEDLITEACSRVTRNLTRAEWEQYIGDALPYQAVCPNLPIEAESTPTP